MDGNSLFKARFRFTEEDDVHLLREVLGLNPYEDHSRWTIIQVNMIQIIGKSLSIRTLRERVQNLIKKFLLKKKEEGRSGIEVEITEIDDLLQQIYELIKEFQNKKGKNILSNNLKENPQKSKIKTSYQKGYEMREEAACSLGLDSPNYQETEISLEIPEVEITHGILDQAVLEENVDLPMPKNVENIPSNQTRPTSPKRPLAQLNIATPTRKRASTGNVKTNTVQYLTKKNDLQNQLKCSELSLQERKLELELYERKKKLELEERRVILEERRLKCHTEIISRQQSLIEELLSKSHS